MNYRVSGSIYSVFETKQVTERFQKRDFVLETSDNLGNYAHLRHDLKEKAINEIESKNYSKLILESEGAKRILRKFRWYKSKLPKLV